MATKMNARLTSRPQLRGYLLAAPLLLALLVAVVGPAVHNALLAFQRYDPLRDAWRFAGLDNFAELFDSPEFLQSLQVTLIWLVGNVALQLLVGLAVALALDRVTRFRGLFGAVVLVPWVSSFVVVAVLFLWILHPQLGVLNDALRRLGIADQPIGWLASPHLAQASLIAANTWKFFPVVTLTLFAGLQGLPRDALEAAAIDGARPWQTLRLVVLPMLAPSIATAVLLSTIWAFNAFTLPIIMTNGGPLRATEVIGVRIFKLAFDSLDFGAAAAASLLLFVAVLAITLAYLRAADPFRR